jgi:hypothetical protein
MCVYIYVGLFSADDTNFIWHKKSLEYKSKLLF